MLRSLVVVVSLGCSPIAQPPDAGARPGCLDDQDCGPVDLFFCDVGPAKCRSKCTTSADCQARPAEFTLAECALVSFTGGTGCTSALVDGTELRLPQACSGDAVTITAELVLPDGVTPLTPPVSTSVTVPLR